MAMPSRPLPSIGDEPGRLESPDDPESSERTMILISVSPEMNRRLGDLADHYGRDKAEVINLAVGLLQFAHDAIGEGKRIGVALPDQELETEIKGL
jgi:hypothetical protein